MLKRSVEPPPEHLFPTDEWRLREARWSEPYYKRAETAFALGNGYLGIRGTHDEGRPVGAAGTFVNGFHETWRIIHAEDAYGLARTGQTIVNVPDPSVIRLYVDDEPLYIPTARLRSYERVLDMQAGTLTRELEWATPAGRHVIVRSCRLVSLRHRHLAAISYEVLVKDGDAPVVISSLVVNRQDARPDRRRRRGAAPRLATDIPHKVLNADVVELQDERMLLGYRTTNSRMTLGVGIEHVIESAAPYETAATLDGETGELLLSVEAERGVPIRLVKLVSYQSSRSETPRELVERCGRALNRARSGGFDALRTAQREHLDRFWDRADVRVEAGRTNARLQQAIRWNLFQVAQATWRAEGAGVPAKGLTGQAYEGHYFWDTEVYLIPYLAYTHPRVARNLLRFRTSMLPYARERARELGLRGALFPWRTINGEEASAYYQAGTAQFHIDADVVYALQRYANITGDDDCLFDVGAETLVETARLWEDLGFHADDGRFHIHSVTGPDEYTTVVNDNTYTNVMATLNLRFAAATVRRLQRERPRLLAALVHELGLRLEELDAWERAADAMHVPFDAGRGINPQDANFLERERWPFETTPAEHYPLLLHYHPLTIYRHQVIKQADVVLAMFLLGDQFTDELKRANFDYYDA